MSTDIWPYIDGEYLQGTQRPSQQRLNPATNASLGTLYHATPEELDHALASAEQTFAAWRDTTPQQRGTFLIEAARLLRKRVEEIAHDVTLEVGKPLAQGRKEAIIAAETLEWFAEEGKRVYGRILPGSHEGVYFSVTRAPVGVVVGLATWNFPVINAARKIGAALAAGCTCIYKPDELAPSAGIRVAQALVDAGLPAGVLNIVFGDPASVSSHLLSSPVVRKLSFTGSVPVGRHLMKLAAERSIRTTMELGGHAPVIVCADTNIEAVAKMAATSKFRNAGQVCVAPTRFFVERPVFNKFVQAFRGATAAQRVGDGLDESIDMGPMIHERRRSSVHALIEDAVGSGAQLECGGHYIDGPGYFYEPTVLSSVPQTARIMSEEPFGPVALINPFDTVESVVDEANRLPFALAAYIFTNDTFRTRYFKDHIEAGMLAFNSFMISRVDAPFSGIKDSGLGAENGIEGLEAYLTTKSISEAVTPPSLKH